MKTRHYVTITFTMLLMLFAMGRGEAKAKDFIFETSAVRLVIDENGAAKSMQKKADRTELLAGTPVPFFSIKKGGKWKSVTKLTRQGEFFNAQFGQSGITAYFRISAGRDRVLIELARLEGTGSEEVRLAQIRTRAMPNTGETLTVLWDAQVAFSLMGLSDKVNSRFGEGMLLASVYPEFGMIGEKVALVAVPTQQFPSAVQKIEKEFKLPSPKINGIWAKSSPDVQTSYLFTDLTEANADETIRYAKLAGFRYILIYSHIWSSSLGSYPINIQNFPRGESGLKEVIDKCHRAGLKVGMHMLTSFVGKNDLFAASQVKHLFSDSGQVLATDIGMKDGEIPARGSMNQFMRSMYEVSRDVRIDEEIIHYEVIGGPGSTMLLQCTRGYAGTRPVPHKAGAKIEHLAEYFGSYLADLNSPLKDTISNRIAGLIDRCGFDMIFFDGENCINGPCWYWGGLQKSDIVKKVKRDLLVEGSGMSHWTWHISTRGYCDDYAAVAPKQYLDYHKIDFWWNFYAKSFMPVELGWLGFLSGSPDYSATMPDEVELYAVRMLALNTPVSLETSIDALRSNGRTSEMLTMLGAYEKLRLSGVVPDSIREKLRFGEWHLTQSGGHSRFSPVKYDTQDLTKTQNEVQINNEYMPQSFKFRLQAGPALAAMGDQSNHALLPEGSTLSLSKPGPTGVSPGMLAARILFSGTGGFAQSANMVQGGTPTNLLANRALALTIKLEGVLPQKKDVAILNVQLESGGFYRDHYIDLDFIGERTIIIPRSNSERMLPDLRPSYSAYDIKAALSGFNFKSIDAVNFRWMRQPRLNPLNCTVTAVEALAETDTVLRNPTIGSSVIPVTLRTGDYLEYWGEQTAQVFDRNGVQLSTIKMPDMPRLKSGGNKVLVQSDGPSAVKLTTILLGTEVPL